METIENILALWEQDAKIDSTEPGKELLNIPTLHNKYLKILVKHRLAIKRINIEYANLKKHKEEYYNGDMSVEDLNERGWEPFQLKIKTRMGIERYLEGDPDLNEMVKKKIHHEEAISVCESILQELKNRVWEIKSFIDWEKFIGGN